MELHGDIHLIQLIMLENIKQRGGNMLKKTMMGVQEEIEKDEESFIGDK